MNIIKTHDVTLYASTGECDIVLRPLCDDDLPLLYKWGADPEVVYWSDTGNVTDFDEESIRSMYGSISENALCFISEVNGLSVGNFWIQKMNIMEVSALYPGLDVRRIEAEIGETDYWGHGIGTAITRMLVEYAFCGENVDVLYCFAADYNLRSQKTLLKHGFTLCGENKIEDSLRAKKEYNYRLTRDEFIQRRRFKVLPDRIFELPIKEIQPSQLYISEGKLRLVHDWFDPADKSDFDPIPIKLYNGRYLMTDGHTRVAAAIGAGWETVPVTWDNNPLDMLAYAEDVRWCKEDGINNALDLAGRIIAHKDYEILWRKRCHDMVIPPSYAAIVARYGGLDGRNNAVILTDNDMEETALLIRDASIAFVNNITVINLDRTDDHSVIYSLAPEDLLILHIGIASWMGRHKKMAHAFNKPADVVSKYVCICPTVTAIALLEGLNTPEEVTASIISKYGALPNHKPVRVTAKNGTDISLAVYEPWTIPHTTHSPGANAYLPPAEISYSVIPCSANGRIVADITVGELWVYADLIDNFGLVDESVLIQVADGMVVDIAGGIMAQKLKAELWKLPDSCRKVVELGIGLSQMSPSGTIGIDESIAGTCHFGFGNGSGNEAPIHLDVVAGDFMVS